MTKAIEREMIKIMMTFMLMAKGFLQKVSLKLDLCEFWNPFISNECFKSFDNHVN